MGLTLIAAEGAVPRSNHNTFVFMPNATEMGVPYWMFKIVILDSNFPHDIKKKIVLRILFL